MAIALEADFRSVKTSQVAEAPERQPGKAGGGEAFASSLARARDAEAAASPEDSSDAAAGAPALPFPPVLSNPAIPAESGAAEPGALQALGADAAAALLKSEIALDRQIVLEGVEAQADGAADAQAATGADAAGAQLALVSANADLALSEATVTPDKANSAAAQEAGKVAAQAGAQSAQTVDSQRAQVAAPVATPDESVAVSTTVSAAASTLAVTATADTKTPVNRQSQPAETPADADAFALAAQKVEAVAKVDVPPADTGFAPLTDGAGKGNPFDTASLNSTTATGTQTLAAVAAPASPQAPAAAASLIQSAPALAVLTASPAQIVDIVAKSADDGQSDRVVVQLDPPELGRVSIDFKFDAQGLQHVTITSETPEAMRQLRQMHSELVQSLERHGIGSENLSFQHQQNQQGAPQTPSPNPFARAAALGEAAPSNAAAIVSTDPITGARTLPGGRLDIRL